MFWLNKSELLALQATSEQLACALLSQSSPQHILESRNIGNLPTRALGSGIDYAESRVYQSGDDSRLINWRLSARSQETFVKTFHIESRPSINVFLDKRRSMIFGTKKRLKVTQATRVASLLAYASEYHHLSFQGWIVDDANDSSNGNAVQYFDDCNSFLQGANQATTIQVSKQASKINTSSVLREINQRAEKGSFVYFISDFIDLDKSYQSDLVGLCEKCFVQAIHIQDKAEFKLPNVGKLRLQDMYQNRGYKLNTKSLKEQSAFHEYINKQLIKRKMIIKDSGVFYTKLLTDVDDLHGCIYFPLGQT